MYVNKGFTKRINGVTKDESDMLLHYLFNVRWDPSRSHFLALSHGNFPIHTDGL